MLISCFTSKKINNLELKNVYEIPYAAQFQGTPIGGLSGIDYDSKSDTYYIISDDRAERNKARVYSAKIIMQNDKIQKIEFENVIFLKDKKGNFFENYTKNPAMSCDPEDIRFYPPKNSFIWSSEGERKKSILQDPTIWFTNLEGDFLSELALPKILKMSSEEQGPRRNGVLEGLTFYDHYQKILTNVEEPLYEDGERATQKKGGLIRLFAFDTHTGKNIAQYYYSIDAIAKNPIPSDAFAVNGVSALLHFKKNKFWLVERSYSTGHASCTIKIYETELKNSKKITKTDHKNSQNKVLDKSLVLNLDKLNIFVDNVEGITLGPKLSNGNPTLILITDNNFSENQKTQIFLFEIKK